MLRRTADAARYDDLGECARALCTTLMGYSKLIASVMHRAFAKVPAPLLFMCLARYVHLAFPLAISSSFGQCSKLAWMPVPHPLSLMSNDTTPYTNQCLVII